ncbi:MAG TPA: ABC transporter permease [Vicinamibacterales bacterium]
MGILLYFKLALRMLIKYPLLTIVGGAGMAFGLAAGVAGFDVRTKMIDPTLPLDEGTRIVGLRNWDVLRDRAAALGLAEFTAWREQLRNVEALSAIELAERNLAVDGTVEPVPVAAMTASGFRVARVLPLLGRSLVETDEMPGSAPVAVIGHALWQRRFAGDPGIVGRSVRLGIEQTTIVGVMPAGFGFPVASQLWVPLGRQSPVTELQVFGRLAPGVTREEARAELTTVGRRLAADAPGTRDALRPEVVPYVQLFFDPRPLSVPLALGNLFLVMLLVVMSANVALLMFARAASREVEIGVRTALGASRARIVLQLFVEAIALSGLSVVVGLIAARYGVRSLWELVRADSGRELPFWFNDTFSSSTIAYGVALMMIGTAIVGVFPALKITGRNLQDRLRGSSAGGGYRFGGVWAAVIVAQVAVTVTFPAWAFFFHRWVVQTQSRDVGVAGERYLAARLVLEPSNASATIDALRRQVTADPDVTALAIADALPGMQHPLVRFNVEGENDGATGGERAAVASIDAGFFSAMDAPLVAGRSFTTSDAGSSREVAIVNVSFVQHVMHGRNPVGRRIRRSATSGDTAPGPWLEIVGVARDLGMGGPDGVGVYRPLAASASTVHVAVGTRRAPESFANRLRSAASVVDPTLRVYDVMRLDQVGADGWTESQYLSRALAVSSGVALLLSLMSVYAVMAFSVVQRTKEIGMRVALGAERGRIVATIVRRPLAQIGVGIVVGGAVVSLLFVGMFNSAPAPLEAGLMVAYATLMLAVCLSACIVPIRRALRLEPSQVLRST